MFAVQNNCYLLLADNQADFFLEQIYGVLCQLILRQKPLQCEKILSDIEGHSNFSEELKPLAYRVFKKLINKINLLRDSGKVIKLKDNVFVLRAVREELFNELIDKVENSKDGGLIMEDIEVIRVIKSLLDRALLEIGESPARLVVQEAHLIANQHLEAQAIQPDTTWVERVAKPHTNPLPPLTEAPIKWANRTTFIVDEIKDEHTRSKLQSNPELVQQIRECTPDKADVFVDIIYGDHIKAGLVYRLDLVGQKRTSTNPNPIKGWDKRLVDVLDEHGLSFHLPNKSDQTDKRLDEAKKAIGNQKLSSIMSAEYRRSKRSR